MVDPSPDAASPFDDSRAVEYADRRTAAGSSAGVSGMLGWNRGKRGFDQTRTGRA